MTIQDWAALILTILSIFVIVVGGLKWLVKHYLSELKPDNNGGHNLEGRIVRLEEKINIIYDIVVSNK